MKHDRCVPSAPRTTSLFAEIPEGSTFRAMRDRVSPRASGLLTRSVCAAVCALGACAAPPPPPAAVPATGGRCRFLRIEEADINRNVGADSVALTLVITPPGQTPEDTTDPVSAKVVVHKERAVGLQAELEAEPHLLCEPEPGSPMTYRVQLP